VYDVELLALKAYRSVLTRAFRELVKTGIQRYLLGFALFDAALFFVYELG
jgi:hypothetical protein